MDGGDATTVRVGSLERRVTRLEDLEPAVMRQRIQDIDETLHQLGRDVSSMRKMFMGFIISFSIASITIVVLIATSLQGKP